MKLWAQITGVDADEIGSHLLPYEKQVPLLIKDVSAILLQFLYALPFNIDKGNDCYESKLQENEFGSFLFSLFSINRKSIIKFKFHTSNRHDDLSLYAG